MRPSVRFRFWVAVLSVVVVATGGAVWLHVVDRPPPAREPFDEIWTRGMLAGHYGWWVNGREIPLPAAGEDRIASSPAAAGLTRHGIRVEYRGRWGQGDWLLMGGLLARHDLPTAAVELFGKEIVRVHMPWESAKYGRDYRYEFFLVLRPRGGATARLVRQWTFRPEEVVLLVARETADFLRSGRSEEDALRLIDRQRVAKVRGKLGVDAASPTAAVTLTGFVECIEERVDLRPFL